MNGSDQACANADYFARAPEAPPRPESGAVRSSHITITFAQAGDGTYDPWPNAWQVTVDEAIKLRDALNALDL